MDHDATTAGVGSSAGTGGAASDSGSLPLRMSQPISLDTDLLGDTPREVLLRVAGTYDFELAAPIGQVSITVPATATTASLVTVVLDRFIEVPLAAQIDVGEGDALRGGKLLIDGTRVVVFELRFDADLLPGPFFATHPEAAACPEARIVFGWDDATPNTAGLQLSKQPPSPDDRVEQCYQEVVAL